MSKKRSSFIGKIGKDSYKQQTAGALYGYLNLPSGISVFTPKVDTRVKLDFIPYEVTDPNHPDKDEKFDIATPGTLWYKRPFLTHRNVGSDNKSNTVVCLKSFGKRCPICEARAELIKKGAPEKEVEALRPSRRNLYLVIPLDSDKHDSDKIYIFDISQAMFQKLLNKEIGENEEYQGFPDLENGYTLKVRFDAESFGDSKPFPKASRIDFLERSSQYDASMLSSVPNLDKVLNELTYEALSAKFYEMEEESPVEDADPDDNQPSQRTEKETSIKRHPVNKVGEEEEEPPKKLVRSQPATKPTKPEEKESSKSPKSSTNRCPHGHNFGEDTEQYNECDNCEIYPECIEANDRLK